MERLGGEASKLLWGLIEEIQLAPEDGDGRE